LAARAKTLLAVLGRDVRRSMSPMMHEAAGWQVGLDVAYLACSVEDREHLSRAMHALRVLGARGANVTMPYKEAAFGLVDRHTPEASELGCVNTLRFDEAGMVGHNTDGAGLLRILNTLPPRHRHRVQVLGSGGAARAAVWAARAFGAEVVVCARRPAEGLAARFGVKAGPLAPVEGATVVLNTVPSRAVAVDRILGDWVDLSAKPFLFDASYDPDVEPALVRAARARGLPAEDGRRMLAEQGALSFAFWTGARVEPVRAAMLRAVGRNGQF
jgi:shikimate dehydrogenase